MAGKAQASAAQAIPPEHTGNVKVSRPQTGAEYLESLRDDRDVYIYGERVKDVTTHPAFRNTARMIARLYDALHDDKRKDKILLPTDTGNGGMTHAFFKAPKTMDEMIAGPQRDRRMGEAHLWLDGPRAGLQGRVPRNARRQFRFLRSVSGQREALVQVQPGARALHQSRDHSSAGRSRPAAERSRRRLLPCRKGNRRRHHRLRRQGGRDRLGADQLHLRRPPRPDPAAGQEFRRRVHGADQCARREIHLPHVVRNDGDA